VQSFASQTEQPHAAVQAEQCWANKGTANLGNNDLFIQSISLQCHVTSEFSLQDTFCDRFVASKTGYTWLSKLLSFNNQSLAYKRESLTAPGHLVPSCAQ